MEPDDWPPTKPPLAFTGKGFEIIGSPETGREAAELWFQDGNFDGLYLPPSLQDSPTEAPRSETLRRRERANLLALKVRNGIADEGVAEELRAILEVCRRPPRERATERDVKRILEGGNPCNWPMQKRRERACVIAVIESATELCRPPTEAEVIDRMMRLKAIEDGQNLTATSERKDLANLLREAGFFWLERRRRGYQGER